MSLEGKKVDVGALLMPVAIGRMELCETKNIEAY